MSVVLLYHSVSDEVEDPWLQVRPETLGRQLDWIAELGYRFVTAEVAVERPAERLAALTFDDGLADFWRAAEILAARSLPVTLFVCPGLAGGRSEWATSPSLRGRPLLRSDEIVQLHRAGVEIGCHGWSHRPFPELSTELLESDLARSVEHLQSDLGAAPASLSYPYGRCDRERAAVAGAFFSRAFAVDPLPGLPARMAIPRLCARDGASRPELAADLARLDLAASCPELDRGL